METKKWFESLGIWGSLIVVACGVILPLFGQADYAALLAGEQAGIVEWLSALGTLIGSGLAFYGRLRAKKIITP